MAENHEGRIIHSFDADAGRIRCGLEDRTAHWTTRSGVNCPRCRELLDHPGQEHAYPAGDAHAVTA